MAAHGYDVLVVRVNLGQPVAQPAHQGIDGLLADSLAGRLWPDGLDHFLPRAYRAGRVIQQLQQAILGEA